MSTDRRLEAVEELDAYLDGSAGALLNLLLSPDSAAGNLIRAQALRHAANDVAMDFEPDIVEWLRSEARSILGETA